MKSGANIVVGWGELLWRGNSRRAFWIGALNGAQVSAAALPRPLRVIENGASVWRDSEGSLRSTPATH